MTKRGAQTVSGIKTSDLVDSYIQGATDQLLEGYKSVTLGALIKALREIKEHATEQERKYST